MTLHGTEGLFEMNSCLNFFARSGLPPRAWKAPLPGRTSSTSPSCSATPPGRQADSGLPHLRFSFGLVWFPEGWLWRGQLGSSAIHFMGNFFWSCGSSQNAFPLATILEGIRFAFFLSRNFERNSKNGFFGIFLCSFSILSSICLFFSHFFCAFVHFS